MSESPLFTWRGLLNSAGKQVCNVIILPSLIQGPINKIINRSNQNSKGVISYIPLMLKRYF